MTAIVSDLVRATMALWPPSPRNARSSRSRTPPSSPDRPWITIVWNDPINLMYYVTHVFMTVFGYPKDKAEKLMLDVHHKGRAVVSSGPRERMELDATTLHGYGLWATLEQQS